MTPRLVDLVARVATRYSAADVSNTHPAAVLAEGVLMMMKLSRLTVAAAVSLVIVTGSATLGAWAMSVEESHAVRSAASASAQIAEPRSLVDVASIRKTLEHNWASLETLEFSAEERFRDPDKSRAYSSYRMEYFLGPGDRRTVSTTFFGPDDVPAVRDEVPREWKDGLSPRVQAREAGHGAACHDRRPDGQARSLHGPHVQQRYGCRPPPGGPFLRNLPRRGSSWSSTTTRDASE